jgi:hypothetical protein
VLHRELRRRAKARKLTLTAYLQDVLEREIARPSPDEELWERIRNLPRFPLGESAVEAVRAGREELDEKWDRLFSTRPSSSADSSA